MANELPVGKSANHSLSTKSTLGIQLDLPEPSDRILGQRILVNLQSCLAEKNFTMARSRKQAPVTAAAANADRGNSRFSACLAVAYQTCAAGNPNVSSAPFCREALDVKTQYQKTANRHPRKEPRIWAPNKTYADTLNSWPSFWYSKRFAA
jgi:hypothetical protein